MKVKCYSIYEGEKEIIAEYSSPSQREFLNYELKGALKRRNISSKIEFENTSNGIWYFRQHPQRQSLTQILLIAKEASSISLAASFFNRAVEMQQKCDPENEREKFRVKTSELIRIFNANQKVDALNSNVMELEELMKGNVNRMISNIGELNTAESKSERMSELSLQFQKDAHELEKKMKRRNFYCKLLAVGVAIIIIGIIVYLIF